MTSDEINKRLGQFDDDNVEPRLCYGWYWREVNFDFDSVVLAYMPAEEPGWWITTLEHMTGQKYVPGGVRFCANNKWGYPMFTIMGDDWSKLRKLCETAQPDAIYAFMQTLHPEQPQVETVQ